MRGLWASNYFSVSAYANQSRLMVPALAKAGHDITVLNIGSTGNATTQVGGITVLPLVNDPLGNDVIEQYVENSQAQAVFTFVDVWAFKADIWRKFGWFPLTPIDHVGIPPAVNAALSATRKPIAISRFGQAQLQAAGIDSFYIPLVYDPKVWYPGDKKSARAELGIGDNLYYVTFIGVNDSVPSRKGIPELLMAWSAYSKQNPNARLRLHTSATGRLSINAASGVNIPLLIKTFNIDPATVSIADPYRYNTGFPASELATLCRASDLLILPSMGEGFGVPLIEAQACGCPVATTNFTTGPELTFGGWLIEGEPSWSWQNAMQMKPGIASIVEVLEAARQERNNPQRRQLAIEGAKEYEVDHVINKYLLPTVREITEIVLERSAQIIAEKNKRVA